MVDWPWPAHRLHYIDIWSNSLHPALSVGNAMSATKSRIKFCVWLYRWMCGVKLQYRIPSKGLRERLGLDDIILVLQQNRLRWYGHVLRKEDIDWVKKCMEYEVEGARPRGRPKKTWREIVEKDCQVRGLNREVAMDRNRWMKEIRGDWWPQWVWVGECFFCHQLTRVVPDRIHRAVNGCVCVWLYSKPSIVSSNKAGSFYPAACVIRCPSINEPRRVQEATRSHMKKSSVLLVPCRDAIFETFPRLTQLWLKTARN